MNKDQLDILIGSLLGDGCIEINGSGNCFFSKSQSIDRVEYLNWLSDKLTPYSNGVNDYLVNKIYFHDGKIKRNSEKIKQCRIRTKVSEEFKQMEKQWYLRDIYGNCIYRMVSDSRKERIKIVPRNITLTPLLLAVWFCDDGNNYCKDRRITFCTNGFSVDDCNYLREILMRDVGFDSNLTFSYKKPMIRLKTKNYLNFIELVKPYVSKWDCFLYKIDVNKYVTPKNQKGINNNNSKLNLNSVERILELAKLNLTHQEICNNICKEFNINIGRKVIGNVLNGKSYKL